MKMLLLTVTALVLGYATTARTQSNATSAPEKSGSVAQEVKAAPASAGQSGIITPVPKKDRPVAKSPVSKKYTSKKIQHGKDKVDAAKKKADVQPGVPGNK